ncbi:MAG: ankyrin repeat domain-containing protein [Legionella sp.]|nr:ankyrin repeat domain-containing protein [Legionella sp.]
MFNIFKFMQLATRFSNQPFLKKMPPIDKKKIYSLENLRKSNISSIAKVKGLPQLTKATGLYSAGIFSTAPLDMFWFFSENVKEKSAVTELFQTLFDYHGGFRPTQNKSNTAYYLTPSVMAHIILALENNQTFSTKEDIQKITHALAPIFRQECGRNFSASQISKCLKFMQLIAASKEESYQNGYLSLLTEWILLAFMFKKAEKPQDLLAYMSVLQEEKEANFKMHGRLEHFSGTDLEAGQAAIAAIDTEISKEKQECIMEANYENIMAYLLLKRGVFLPEVTTKPYAYGDSKPQPNCVEAGIQNLCNILLYDGKGGFDLSLVDHLPISEQLKTFYTTNDQAAEVNEYRLGQTFFDMLSAQSSLSYLSENYELMATSSNFLAAMNYLFGTRANSLAELSQAFSSEKKSIVFFEKGNHVVIQLVSAGHREQLIFYMMKGHGELNAARFKQKIVRAIESTPFTTFAREHQKEYPLVFATLLAQSSFEKNYAYLCSAELPVTPEEFHQLFIFSPPQSYNEFFRFFILSLGFPPNHLIDHFMLYACKKYNVDMNWLLRFGLAYNPKAVETAIRIRKLYGGRGNTLYKENVHPFKEPEIGALINAGMQENPTYGRTDLFYINDLVQLEACIKAGADLNARDLFHQTPLFHMLGKDPKIIARLIGAGAHPDLTDAFGRTPLFYVNNPQEAELFIAAGINLDTTDFKGQTALFYVPTPVRALMIQAGMDVNVIDPLGKSALFYEVSVEMVKMYIEAGADINIKDEKGKPYLFNVANPKILQVLIVNEVDVNIKDAQGNTYLYYAPLGLMQDLINAGSKVNTQNERGETPLFVRVNQLEVVKLLLSNGSNVNHTDTMGKTALSYVRDPQIAQYLIDAGADVHSRDQSGRTPFINVGSSADRVRKILIDAGADVNAVDNERKSALFYVDTDDLEALKFLVKNGANVNLQDKHGNTRLFHRGDNLALTKYLIQKAGIDVNIINHRGETALFNASFDKMKLLINAGVDVDVINKNGEKFTDSITDPEQLEAIKNLIDQRQVSAPRFSN